MKKTFYDYCLEQGKTALLQQWDVEKNGSQTPHDLSYGSKRKAWWRCAQGHSWQAAPCTRTAGSGCPYCANRLLAPGENDLAAACPQLVEQWDFAKNHPLAPWDLTAGSRKRVWWRCDKGHQWQALVVSRSQGAGCPVCAGKVIVPGENDLASRFPQVATQWDVSKNGTLTPEACSPSSNRKVWWTCPLGHGYQAAVSARTASGSGCPYCAGRKVLSGFNDLATLEPAVAASWHPSLNGALEPEMVTVGSRRKVWWQCPEGHSWKAAVYSRTGAKKCGCPVCAGRGRPQRQRRYGPSCTVPGLEDTLN